MVKVSPAVTSTRWKPFSQKYPCSGRAAKLLKASDQGIQRAVINEFRPRVEGAVNHGAEVVMSVARHRRVLTLQARPRQIQPEPGPEQPPETQDAAIRRLMGLGAPALEKTS